MERRQLLHTTLYCSSLSPCGNYLAVGSNFGYIYIFNITNALSLEMYANTTNPACSFKAHPGPVHSLQTVSKYLVSAGYGPIIGWKWSDIISLKPCKSFTLSKTSSSTSRDSNFCTDIFNCLTFNPRHNILYAGADDSIISAWDLKTETFFESFNGHKAYVHDINMACNSLLSCSEDGCVKIWDTRTANCLKTFIPHSKKELNRPELGKWISCVASDPNGQWIACGGGPRLSLWHLRSGSLISSLSDKSEESKIKNELSPNTICFYEDEIIAAGNQANIHRWHLNGESKAVIPCSISNIFSISFKPTSKSDLFQLPMIVTGNSFRINIFTNLGYLGSTLKIA